MTRSTPILVIAMVSVLLVCAARSAGSDEGRRLYLTYCAACHGVDGRGAGKAASGLEQHPADLTTEGFLITKSDLELRASITGGDGVFHGSKYLPGMKVAFTDAEIFSLIGYLRSFQPIPSGDPLEGRRLYNLYCIECHGSDGRGGGRNASYLDVQPMDLTDDRLGSKNDRELFEAIESGGGVHGSKFMPRWSRMLRGKDVWDLVTYVRFLNRARRLGGDPFEGNALFDKYCISCHGARGKGDGPMASVLEPPPGDLSSIEANTSTLDIYFIVFGGGTPSGLSEAMPAWKDLLTTSDIRNLTAFIDSLRIPPATETIRNE